LDDVETNEADMKRWVDLSSGKCVYKAFDGGHFYTQANVAKIAETIEYVAEFKALDKQVHILNNK
jgi:surfactin synthase thioesterase subunit